MDTEYMDVLKKCHDVNTISVAYQDGLLKQRNKTVQPSMFRNLVTYAEDLKKQRIGLMRSYYDVYERLVHTNASLNAKQQKEFNDLVHQIQSIDEELDDIRATHHVARRQARPQTAIDKYKHLSQQSAAMYNAANVYDTATAKKLGDNARTLLQLDSEIKNAPHVSDYTMVHIGKILRIGTPKSTNTSPSPSNKHITKKAIKEKTKAKKVTTTKKVVNDLEKNAIKENVKELIKHTFAFKTKEECTSSKRSQPYYENKDSIVEKISKNENLKKLMPSNYKSLPKEKICEELFSI